MCLALDKKGFDGVCKNDSTRPNFVQVVETAKATIATDLEKVLAATSEGG
jgi:hypothetical protein